MKKKIISDLKSIYGVRGALKPPRAEKPPIFHADGRISYHKPSLLYRVRYERWKIISDLYNKSGLTEDWKRWYLSC